MHIYRLMFAVLIKCSNSLYAERWVLLVNAFSSGRDDPEIYTQLGYKVAHLTSSSYVPDFYQETFRAELFKPENLRVWDTSNLSTINEIKEWIARMNPAAIVPGSDGGVVLANTLAKERGLPFNGGENIAVLSDKYLQQKTLRDQGLSYIPTTLANRENTSAVRQWIHEERLAWPLVVKPRSSAGTDHVYIVQNHTELEALIDKVVGIGRDYYGRLITELLVQPFVEGEEIAPDKIVIEGEKYDAETVVYRKTINNDAPIYSFTRYANSEEVRSDLFQKIDLYLNRVFEVFGIKVGYMHPEVFVQKDGKIVLGELNARSPGGRIPQRMLKWTGRDHSRAGALSYVNSAAARSMVTKFPEIRGSWMTIDLIVPEGIYGPLKSIDYPKDLLNSPLIQGVNLYFKEDHMLKPTVDMDSSPGEIDIYAETLSEAVAFHDRVRDAENNRDVFTVKGSLKCNEIYGKTPSGEGK